MYIEEIRRLQFASTRMHCTIQALNVSNIRYWICPKLSIFVIVRSLLDIFFAIFDVLFTKVFKRGLNTCYNTHELRNTLALLYTDVNASFDKVCTFCLGDITSCY